MSDGADKMICTYCGADLKKIDNRHAKCTFCGQTILLDDLSVDNNHKQSQTDNKPKSNKSNSPNKPKSGFKYVLWMAAAIIIVCIIYFGRSFISESFEISLPDFSKSNSDKMLTMFCEDIFEKSYKEITAEEFESIKYIRYDYRRYGSENYHTIDYSFTDYEDCETEEEFLETIVTWKTDEQAISWPSDYTMFTGLTRIDTCDTVWLSQLKFSPESRITYVASDDEIDTIIAILNEEYIKVLHTGSTVSKFDGIGQFTDLEVLIMDSASVSDEIDISELADCSKLKQLEMTAGITRSGYDTLGSFTNMQVLNIHNLELKECAFLSTMPHLEELYISGTKDADFGVLADLPELKKLIFDDNEQKDIYNITSLTGLEELRIGVCDNDELMAVSAFGNLKNLDIYLTMGNFYDAVEFNLSVLSELSNLDSLKIRFDWETKTSGVESLFAMQNLKELSLTGDIMGTDININGELMQPNDTLEVLDIRKIELNKYVMAENNDSLEDSDKWNNFMSYFTNLSVLVLIDCEIENIDFVSGMKNLVVCVLERNSITNFRPLSDCRKLKVVYAFGNPTKNINVPDRVTVYRDTPYPY